MGSEEDELVSCVALAKLNVNINTTTKREVKGGDLNFHVYMLAIVLARHILISNNFKTLFKKLHLSVTTE